MAEYGFLPRDHNFATRAITTRSDPRQWDSWSVVTPISLGTTYLQSAPAQPLVSLRQYHSVDRSISHARIRHSCPPPLQKYIYGRSGNPTREVLEDIMAALENAKYGVCFSSGLGCVRVIAHLLKAGDHLLTMSDLYGGVYRIFEQFLPESGVQTEFIDLTDVNTIHARVKKNTKVSEKRKF